MANISNYSSDVISEVPHSKTYHNDDMENLSVHALQDFEQSPVMDFTDNEITSDSNIILLNKEQNNESVTAELERYKERVKTFEQRLNINLSCREKMIDFQMDDMIKEKLALKQQIDSLKKNLSKQIKEKESLLQTFTVFKSESKEKEDKYMENKIDLEKKIKKLDNIIYKVGQSTQIVHLLTKRQVFYDNIHKQALDKPPVHSGKFPSELPKKELVDIAAQTPSAYTIVPSMFKLDFEPLALRLLQNREAHTDYLKYTQEQADILWGIVKQDTAKQPLDNALDFASPLFLWAEAINTACYTLNRSIIRRRYNKTPYELMQDKKLDLSFFHVFGALCSPTNDNDDLGKLDAKADIGIFVGYAPAKKAFRIYNKRT
ncbi:integrase, catalytic region, zinc finger, CCHC-type containing protein [Tanacetum coccineum]